MNTEQLLNQYHAMLDEFAKGNPQLAKAMYSHAADVMLANPFGATVVGWAQVSQALDFASSKFKDGRMVGTNTIAKYVSPQFIMFFEIESWRSKVGGSNTISSFDLRVSSSFRLENDTWKLVHRHADPISTFNADGPVRKDL